MPSFAYPGLQTFASGTASPTGAISLEWDPSPDAVDGYRVYYGLGPRDYTLSEDVGPGTTHTFRGLDAGKRTTSPSLPTGAAT